MPEPDKKDLEIKMLNSIINQLIIGNINKENLSIGFGVFHIELSDIKDDDSMSYICKEFRREIDALIMDFESAII